MNARFCVYLICHIPSGRCYVGKTCDPVDRFRHHRAQLNAGRHVNGHLQRAWAKYGEATFQFQIHARYATHEAALAAEIETIAQLRHANSPLFNITHGGETGPMTPEHCQRISEGLKASGHKPGPLAMERARLANTGKKHSTEFRQARSENAKKLYAEGRGLPEALHRPKSDDHKRKIGTAQKGRIFTSEHLANLRAAQVRRRARERGEIESN